MLVRKLFTIIISGFLLASAVKAYYDTNSIEIRHYQIENSPLGEVLNGLKVAHLSDLHIKNVGIKENKIVEILKEEKPDLIFITGDLISFEGPYEPFISFLHKLTTSLGVYGVLGNTEYSNENGSCILCHGQGSKNLKKKQNAVFLRNFSVPLKIKGKTVNIVGVDDPVSKKSNLRTALEMVSSKNPTLLLAHSPEIFDEASGSGIDFLLCGHTHGGQIFLTRYLRKLFPLEPSLAFLEGFFQKGKMLMYVSRGIGTSYLPFRMGIKPEVTFFKFSNNTINPSKSINSSNPNNPSNPINSVISNTPSTTIFTGFNLIGLIETFNILGSTNPMNQTNSKDTKDTNILFDFESEEDLKRLNWECHKWFELSKENVTSGNYSLKVSFPPGRYPGIDFKEIKRDWSGFRYLKMDVFNPSAKELNFHIRIDDNKSGLEYANRFDIDFELGQGMNKISIPLGSIKTNIYQRLLNVSRIKRMIVFVPNNAKQREIFMDNIRLE